MWWIIGVVVIDFGIYSIFASTKPTDKLMRDAYKKWKEGEK